MRCIKVLTDEDFLIKKSKFNNPENYYCVKGVILNDNGQIAFNCLNENEYKLIGFKIKETDDPVWKFKKDLDNIGVNVEIDDRMGTINEERSISNIIKHDYIYLGHINKFNNIDDNIIWLNLNDALELFQKQNTKYSEKIKDNYEKLFASTRDYTILKYYAKNYC